MGARRPLAVVMMRVAVCMGMFVTITMVVIVVMRVAMIMVVILPLDPGLAFAAAAYCTHLSSPRAL